VQYPTGLLSTVRGKGDREAGIAKFEIDSDSPNTAGLTMLL